MQKINKINLKVISQENGLGSSRLEFKISGSDINYIVANTIRRTIMSDIPIYAFNEFNFQKNSSIFHNNFMKLRLRQMPVWNIDNTMDILQIKEPHNNVGNIMDTVIEEDENADDDIQLNVENKINDSTLKQMTMYVEAKNNTKDIITITTNDAKFYYNEKQIESPYKIAIPIVKLHSNQEIAFSAITNVGIEEQNAMYSAVCICVYKQINDNEFDFIVESRGQLTEKRIIQVALINIENKLQNLIKLLNNNKIVEEPESTDKLQGKLIVNNEDHTLGNLISRGMQLHNKVSFAGYNMPHPLGKKVNFEYKLKSGDVKLIIKDVVNYYSELFSEIKKGIDKF
jgi:DNA-directed RNA polymerase II subunit RPB11